jgi:hypothetical protein
MKLRKHRGIQVSAPEPIIVTMAKEMQTRKDGMRRLSESDLSSACEQWRNSLIHTRFTYRDLLVELSQPRGWWQCFRHGFLSWGASRTQPRIHVETFIYNDAAYDDWATVGNDLCDAYTAYTIAGHGRTNQPEAQHSWR